MKISLKNNVRTTMASRNITMWKDFAERLDEHQGYSITRTSLSRQVGKEVPAYSMELIEALCNELQCLPNDLFYIEVTEASPEDTRMLTRREKPFEFGYIEDGQGSASDMDNPTNLDQSTSASQPPVEDEDDELLGERVSHQSAEKIRNGDS